MAAEKGRNRRSPALIFCRQTHVLCKAAYPGRVAQEPGSFAESVDRES
jgi:hypothetical protein